MLYCISKDALGTQNHLLIDSDSDTVKWVAFPPEDVWYYGFTASRVSLEPLLQIYGLDINEMIPNAYREAMRTCGVKDSLPWRFILPSGLYRKRMKLFLDEIRAAILKLKESLYLDFFKVSNDVLFSLYPSLVDVKRAKSILEEKEVPSLHSFLKRERDKPLYSRSSTKTGRLTIKAGPKILTLPREMKSLFKPSEPHSQLFEIDFVSLEPRVARYLANKDLLTKDVYTHMIAECKLDIDRDTAKLATLCVLYGAGKSKLFDIIKDRQKVSKLQAAVEDYFGIKKLSADLFNMHKNDCLTNFFGRPLYPDDSRKSLLVNNFLQSTAADVALYGFSTFIRDNNGLKPLFVIHDALIIEVPLSCKPNFLKAVRHGIEIPELGVFSLAAKEL